MDGLDATKTCEACGAEFARPKGRSRAEFARRKFCSRECGGSGTRRDTSRPRPCWSGRHTIPAGVTGCAECHRIRNRTGGENYRPGEASRRRTPTHAPRIVVDTAPTWRPAGFAPVPNTKRGSA